MKVTIYLFTTIFFVISLRIYGQNPSAKVAWGAGFTLSMVYYLFEIQLDSLCFCIYSTLGLDAFILAFFFFLSCEIST